MISFLNNYIDLSFTIKNARALLDPRPVDIIHFKTEETFVRKYRSAIEAVEEKFDPCYRSGFLAPLRERLPEIIDKLLQPRRDPDGTVHWDPKRYVTLETLVNAALQPYQEELQGQVKVVQTIISELFETFKNNRTVFGVEHPLIHASPPLVSFLGQLPDYVSKEHPFPWTLEVITLQDRYYLGDQLSNGFTAGCLGVPPGYIQYPLLWGMVGHEIGGHYILSSDKWILPELQKKIFKTLAEQYTHLPEEAVAPLWRYWTEEAASDVCEILNLGPSAGIGILSAYTAILPLWNNSPAKLSDKYNWLDWHPIPLLVPDVLCGAIETLDKLSDSRRVRYIAQLEEIARHYARQVTDIHFEKPREAQIPYPVVRDPADRRNPAKNIRLPPTIQLRYMRESARAVGRFIATVKLDALKGHSLQDLSTWTESHEQLALEVAEAIANPELLDKIKVNGQHPTPMQLISGGILAVVRRPNLFDDVNRVLYKEFSRY
ncbi:MAG TPA: hypothetical protein VGQ08_08645 [Nitrospiraceae bacterium]|jgi:hypothetical protein|nr:hypothetical protein [Nitrospiraceae bacterium]